MKFRKKPVVIEAVRILATDYNGIDWDGSPFSEAPDWLAAAVKDGTLSVLPSDRDYAMWQIKTLEGVMTAGPDDWIIRGVKGEIYPCRDDIFQMTYEPVP